MNLVETYVTNITEHIVENKGRCNMHYIVADFNCHGHVKRQEGKWLSDCEYQSIVENGWYLS